MEKLRRNPYVKVDLVSVTSISLILALSVLTGWTRRPRFSRLELSSVCFTCHPNPKLFVRIFLRCCLLPTAYLEILKPVSRTIYEKYESVRVSDCLCGIMSALPIRINVFLSNIRNNSLLGNPVEDMK